MANFWENTSISRWALGKEPKMSTAAAKELFREIPSNVWTMERIIDLVWFVSWGFRDEKFVLIMEYIPPELRTKELWLAVVAKKSSWIEFVPVEMLTESFIIEAVRLTKSRCLKYVPDSLKAYNVCCAAIKFARDKITLDMDVMSEIPPIHQTVDLIMLAMDSALWAGRWNLESIVNQTTEICVAIVKRMPTEIKHLREQPREACLIALADGGPEILDVIREQTEELCLIAVGKTNSDGPASLRCVRDQTEKICLAALRACTTDYRRLAAALRNIRSQTPLICLTAYSLDNIAYVIRVIGDTLLVVRMPPGLCCICVGPICQLICWLLRASSWHLPSFHVRGHGLSRCRQRNCGRS
ncbi:MAG: hypothetical protein WC052_04485 [Patescibacteria group bacterium]